jgi:hypothetical protein
MLEFREGMDGGLLPGELGCVRRRQLTGPERARIDVVEGRRRQKLDQAATRAASEHDYDVSSGYDPKEYERAHAAEEKIKAMEAYAHGGGGICPFERSLCP